VAGRPKDPGTVCFFNLLDEIPKGRVKQGKLVKRILGAATNIQMAIGKPADKGFSDGIWDDFLIWRRRVEERYGKLLKKIHYMHEEYYEDVFWNILVPWYSGYQHLDTWEQHTEQYIPPFNFTPCENYKFDSGPYPLVRDGTFAIMVGANGSGKSNFLAWLGLELSDYGIHVITNLKYYGSVDAKNEFLHVTDTFSEMLKHIARILMKDHKSHIVVILDEMDSFMNAKDQSLKMKQRSYILKVMWQMRKLNVTLIGNFKSILDVDLRWREGEKRSTGGNVLCRIYKGGYPNYDDNRVEYFPKQDIMRDTIFLRFPGRKTEDVLLHKIPDMKDVYFHGQPTDLNWDVDVLQMLDAMRKIERPWSADDAKKYYQNLGETMLNNIDDWICDRETAVLIDEEDTLRQELEKEIHEKVVKDLQMELIIKKRAEGMKFGEVTKLVNDAFDTDLTVGAAKMRVQRRKREVEDHAET